MSIKSVSVLVLVGLSIVSCTYNKSKKFIPKSDTVKVAFNFGGQYGLALGAYKTEQNGWDSLGNKLIDTIWSLQIVDTVRDAKGIIVKDSLGRPKLAPFWRTPTPDQRKYLHVQFLNI